MLALSAMLGGITILLAGALWGLHSWWGSDVHFGYPSAGVMPAGFEQDNSPEARAFKATCSQCHSLPSPSIYDAAGWHLLRPRMEAQMAARSVVIPEDQVSKAIAYAAAHGKDASPRPESQPS